MPSEAFFDESFHIINAGVPRFLVRKPLKAWEEVIDIVQEYLEENKEDIEELSPFLKVALEGRQAGWACRLAACC